MQGILKKVLLNYLHNAWVVNVKTYKRLCVPKSVNMTIFGVRANHMQWMMKSVLKLVKLQSLLD